MQFTGRNKDAMQFTVEKEDAMQFTGRKEGFEGQRFTTRTEPPRLSQYEVKNNAIQSNASILKGTLQQCTL